MKMLLNIVRFSLCSLICLQFSDAASKNVRASASRIQYPKVNDIYAFLAENAGKKNKLALLLDYDGTLAAIAPKPELAVLPKQTKELLERLSKNPNINISIISGRAVNDVKKMVQIDGITYAGNHGLEIHYPKKEKRENYLYPVPSHMKLQLEQLQKELEKQVCVHEAWVENKTWSLTYHYRQTPDGEKKKLIQSAKELIEQAGLVFGEAHEALEIKLPLNWGKAEACKKILETKYTKNWKKTRSVIFIGDDKNDEGAIKEFKNDGATFRVTNNPRTITNARMKLADTNDVITVLKWVEKYFKYGTKLENTIGLNQQNASSSKPGIKNGSKPKTGPRGKT